MSVLSRRELLAAATTAALPAQSAAQAVYRTPTPRRPNILCIMVDEMRWDAMSCQGHPLVETPTLDSLAKQGTRFENCYTVSPVCCPARACFFSSRYAHVNGVESNGYPARDGEIFLPSILRHHGYHTAISGKLHYTPKQFDYGFDQFWTFTNE
ncbi:MAG: sulfatase-like hydrolase/transferase, partial [Acidobacteria bacterium]|nr:sulfatase-like hydrolase/transferase [Acidobacteriota bacterium]